MTRLQTLTLACSQLGLLSPVPADKAVTYLNIQPQANQDLAANLGRGAPGNNLLELPRGEQALGGVRFKVEEHFIQLGSPVLRKKMPDKVEGIPVGRAFARLQILHGTFYGTGKTGDPTFVADGTLIGLYKVHYEDGSSEAIPIVYGEDVRDWWFAPDQKEVSHGKVAWEGDNKVAKAYGMRLRLYLGTWANPQPMKTVTRIDYVKEGQTPAAPFCIALTMEE
jgi:hypothetical protein